MILENDIMSLGGLNSGYTVKYSSLPSGVPLCIPRLVLIRIQSITAKGSRVLCVTVPASFPCFRHLLSTDSQIYDFTLRCSMKDTLQVEKGEVMAGTEIGAGGAAGVREFEAALLVQKLCQCKVRVCPVCRFCDRWMGWLLTKLPSPIFSIISKFK